MFKTLEVYYKNTRGLRSKSSEFISNILSSYFDLVRLTETWLCAGISDNSYFPSGYSVYRQDRDHDRSGMKFGGGALIAVKCVVQSHWRVDWESYVECVWVEIPASYGYNYLVGNYYFPPFYDDAAFIEHFESLQKTVDFTKYRVQIYGDFNLPGIDWAAGTVSFTASETSKKAYWLLSFLSFLDF